jgi:hypothetical protein
LISKVKLKKDKNKYYEKSNSIVSKLSKIINKSGFLFFYKKVILDSFKDIRKIKPTAFSSIDIYKHVLSNKPQFDIVYTNKKIKKKKIRKFIFLKKNQRLQKSVNWFINSIRYFHKNTLRIKILSLINNMLMFNKSILNLKKKNINIKFLKRIKKK